MKIVIELSDENYKDIKEENSIYGINNGLSARITGKVVGAIQNGTPHETVTEFADRCRECGREKVLDKIRAEIETKYGQCDICEYFEDYDYEENDISEYRPIGNIVDILQIIDKYKAESEECFSALRPS